MTTRAEILTEARYLAGTDTWESIARRLGYSGAASLARVVWRAGDRDLSAQVVSTTRPLRMTS